MNNIMHEVNGLAVPQRQEDGYVNATKLCKAAGKLWANYYQLKTTKEYLEALSADIGIPISAHGGLIQVKRGGNAAARINQGTWVHPDVAVDLAQWLSPQFRILVNRWIREWMSERSQPQRQKQHQMLWWDRGILFQKHTTIPDGYWCVFMELNNLLIPKLEIKGFVFPDGACPDISVGLCWCRYLREQGIKPEDFPDYDHHYPDQRGVQAARIYPDELLPMFRRWLRATYIPGQFPSYVRQMCSADECNMVAQAIGYEIKPVLRRSPEAKAIAAVSRG